ncbi:YciI family protein [Alicyclobacillus fastidiosus]|uniref:YciI family protein n=1 Tax=Alicyclobacillus fastidiosus TaxID=392011 RepID=A0ABY6ZJW6_9BACL|nr:YciI family protein [Alicyclobacillus fastidiosus]WAH43179.1 YciI family protein [Alicyclobacillus fastidiosus]GMA65202.1 hypothetical protein GCM10025859_56420 [Alicyclobacillus fastidiosus]
MKHVALLTEGTQPACEGIVEEHRKYLTELRLKGLLASSGPFQNVTGGLLIYNVADFDAALEIIRHDPIIESGCRHFELYTWANQD